MSVRTEAFLDQARGRLVPWLPPAALLEHTRQHPASTTVESIAVAARALSLNEPGIWADMVGSPEAPLETLRAAREVIESLENDEALALTDDLLDRAHRIFEAPLRLERVTGIVAELPTAEESRVVLRAADGTTTSVYVLPEISVAQETELESTLTLDAFTNACGELQVAAIRDEPDDSSADPSYINEIHGRSVDIDRKSAFAKLLRVASDRGVGSVSKWTALAEIEILPYETAEEVVGILEKVLTSQPDLEEAVSDTLISSEGFYCYGTLALRLIGLALEHSPAEGINGRKLADRLMDYLADERERLMNDIAPALREMADHLQTNGFADTVQASLDELDASTRASALGSLLGPVSAGTAADRAVADLVEAVGSIQSAEDPAADTAEAALAALRSITRRDKAAVRKALRSARYSAHVPRLATSLLETYEAAGGARRSFGAEFLRTALSDTTVGAEIGVRYALAAAPLKAASLEAVIAAIAEHPEAASLTKELAAVVEANRGAIPKLEQLGIVAAASGPDIADRVAREANTPGNLEKRLFVVARNALRRHPDIAEKRLRYAELWSHAGREARAVASDSYQALLKEVQTKEQLRVVLESMLRFFPTADRIPGVGDLRTQGLAAVSRVAPSESDEELAQLIQRAISQLRWDVSSKRKQVARVLRRLGL